MLTFLHLSDLHFTVADADTQFDRDAKIRSALIAALGSAQPAPFDAILVTGDIAYHGTADEFQRAKIWLEELRTKTVTSPEALFVVPGNHDVNRKCVPKGSSLWDLHQSIRAEADHEAREASLEKKLKDPFDFLTAMSAYRAFAGEYACPTEPLRLAWAQVLEDKPLDDGTLVRLHGINTAILSDEDDRKASLLAGDAQFHRLSSESSYVEVVLCHHPHAWLIDGERANDYYRNQAHIVLSGHDHSVRCYREGGSLRLFAGALHPNRREPDWEPCFHILRLSIAGDRERELIARVETHVWRDKDKCFVPYPMTRGALVHEERLRLSARGPGSRQRPRPFSAVDNPGPVASSRRVPLDPPADVSAAARRKLVVHFFRLGTLARYSVVINADLWEDSDDQLAGQARWARIFERAERSHRLGALWDAVAELDETLRGQPNPFAS